MHTPAIYPLFLAIECAVQRGWEWMVGHSLLMFALFFESSIDVAPGSWVPSGITDPLQRNHLNLKFPKRGSSHR